MRILHHSLDVSAVIYLHTLILHLLTIFSPLHADSTILSLGTSWRAILGDTATECSVVLLLLSSLVPLTLPRLVLEGVLRDRIIVTEINFAIDVALVFEVILLRQKRSQVSVDWETRITQGSLKSGGNGVFGP